MSRTPGWPRSVQANHTHSDLEYLVSLPWYLYQGPFSCTAPVGGRSSSCLMEDVVSAPLTGGR